MKILVIRLSSIGDVILTTPILRELRFKFPQAKIDFIVMDKFKEAIRGNSNIDNLIVFEKEKYKGLMGIYKFTKNLEKYDLVIDLHSKMRSKLITKFLGSKTLRYKKRVWWKTLLVKLRLIKYSVDASIIRNYFAPLKNFGIEYEGEKLEFNFEEKDLEKIEIYNNYVVFAPGASKETKKWTSENFAKLAVLVKKEWNKDIILIGGKNEKKELDKINNLSGNLCINLAGELSLKESGALLSKADFLVTNDSGPFHIGRGVGTLSFVIFGPTDPNMFEYNDRAILLYANEPCSPCSLHGDKKCPKGHFNCMRKLDGEHVMNIIKKNYQTKRMKSEI